MKKKDFKIDYSIVNDYIKLKTFSSGVCCSTLLVQYKGNKDKKFVLKIGLYRDIFPEVYIALELKANSLASNIPKINKFGKVDDTFKKYGLKYTKNLYFVIIEYFGPNELGDVIKYQLIDIYKFKQLMKQFIKYYSKANKKTGFIHWDLKFDNLFLNKNKTKIMFIDLGKSVTKKSYSLKDFKDKIYQLGFQRFEVKKHKFILTKFKSIQKKNIRGKALDRKLSYYKNMDLANRSIYKIKFNTIGSWDIINLLRIINTAERLLTKIPKQITLNKEQIEYFNKDLQLYEKLDYLSKFEKYKKL